MILIFAKLQKKSLSLIPRSLFAAHCTLSLIPCSLFAVNCSL